MTRKGKQSTKAMSPRPQGPGPNTQKKSTVVPKGQRQKGLDSAPVSQQRAQRMTAPNLTSSPMKRGDARIRVRHREYLQDVNGSVAFTNTAIPIQPGLISSFPWLAQVAGNYESYEFNSLSFEYETQCSTATAGKIMIAIDYDASDIAPLTKTDLMAFHDAVSSASWQECCFTADKQDLKKFGVQRYIRRGTVSNTDIKTYDVGTLNIASQGMSGASAVGELYVSYDVELMTPQLAQNPISINEVAGGTISKTAPFGTAPVSTGNLPVTVSNANNLATVVFNTIGQFLVETFTVGTTLVAPTQSGTSTIVALVGLINTGSSIEEIVTSVNVTSPGQTYTQDYSGSATLSALTMRIAQYTVANG